MKMPALRIRKYNTYRVMPWRNGRGSTLEIGREPANGQDFAWRLSLADIDADGEFSAYPGYRRALVLVAGNGLRLTFVGHGSRFLDPSKRATRFEGEWTTRCAIPQGRCTDLSLIVGRGSSHRPTSLVRAPRMMRLESRGRVTVGEDLHGALFVIAGSVAVAESTHARSRTLHLHDTLLISPGRERTVPLRRLGSSPAQLAFLIWRPGAT
jgi:environmental stress-induced protein Ves